MTATKKEKLGPLLYTLESHWEDIEFFQKATSLDELKEYRKEKYYPEPIKSKHYPRHKEFYDQLEDTFPGMFLMENGGTIPYEGNGFIGKSKAFHVRSRGGLFSISIYDLPEQGCSVKEAKELGYDHYYHGLDLHKAPFMAYVGGVPSEDYWNGQDIGKWEEIMKTITPHPYLYQFNSIEPDHDSVIKDEQGEIQYPVVWTKGISHSHRIAYAWGDTPAQAYENLCDEHYNPAMYRIDRPHASPEAINAGEDTRTIPDPLPDFTKIVKTPLKFSI